MEKPIYTITLDDGTQIKNLTMNGTCFVSKERLDPDIFEGNLAEVIISHEGVHETRGPLRFIEAASPDNDYYFVLLDISQEELWRMKMEATMNYFAMMSDIDL